MNDFIKGYVDALNNQIFVIKSCLLDLRKNHSNNYKVKREVYLKILKGFRSTLKDYKNLISTLNKKV